MIVGLEEKLCEIEQYGNWARLVLLNEEYAVLFRYEDTQDDRANGKKKSRYRCIVVCRIDNQKYGKYNGGAFTWRAKYHEELDHDINLTDIYWIQLYERHDNMTLGMLLTKYGTKINKAIEEDIKKMKECI